LEARLDPGSLDEVAGQKCCLASQNQTKEEMIDQLDELSVIFSSSNLLERTEIFDMKVLFLVILFSLQKILFTNELSYTI
jgi:hypothetical protein